MSLGGSRLVVQAAFAFAGQRGLRCAQGTTVALRACADLG